MHGYNEGARSSAWKTQDSRLNAPRNLGGEDVEKQQGKERKMGGTRRKGGGTRGGTQVGVRGRRVWRTEKMIDLMDAEQNDVSG